jgi:hypothetical protein
VDRVAFRPNTELAPLHDARSRRVTARVQKKTQSGTHAPPDPQSVVHSQLPVVTSHEHAEGRHAFGSQVVPVGQPLSQPSEGSGPLQDD